MDTHNGLVPSTEQQFIPQTPQQAQQHVQAVAQQVPQQIPVAPTPQYQPTQQPVQQPIQQPLQQGVVPAPAPYQQNVPLQTQPVQQHQQAPVQPTVTPGMYDFQVAAAKVYKNVPDKFNEGRTKDELRLDVYLLGTQDPTNPGQPIKASISNINVKVRSLIVDTPNGRVETGLNKVFNAFGIHLNPNSNPDTFNWQAMEGLIAHGQVEIGKRKGTPYINKSKIYPSQNPEYVAQNQARAQQLVMY